MINIVKRDSSIDTLRVLACLLVILSHYSYTYEGSVHLNVSGLFGGLTGRLGVSIFFAISGYLAAISLQRLDSLIQFYITKFLRIVIPWFVSYWVLTLIIMCIGFINPVYMAEVPFYKVIFQNGSLLDAILFMVPYETYVATKFYNFEYLFIGEWFLGTLFIMYIIAPFIKKGLSKSVVTTSIGVIAISIGSYMLLYHLGDYVWWLWVTRLPEFVLGMILYQYKEILIQKKIIYACLVIGSAGFIVNYQFNQDIHILWRIISLNPLSFLVTMPSIYFLFILIRMVQGIPGIKYINKLAVNGYAIMLIQHVVIYLVIHHIPINQVSRYGIVFLFFFIVILIILISHIIQKLYKPLEDYLVDIVNKRYKIYK